jgi:acetyltransferase-like isoleucine patch superfamily enzyme
MNFISSKARTKGFFEGDNVVLGPSTIGIGSVVGRNVIIGYPIRKSLQSFDFSQGFGIEKFDEISRGATIGRNCIIRSGTVIYETVTLGNWVETGHNVLIREGSLIGDKTRIGSSTQIDGAVRIGRNVSVQSNVYLPHLTVIFLAPSVVLTNDPYPPSQCLKGIVVERGAVIGANACIVTKVTIGEGAVVSAGAVVTQDVPPFTVVMGAPARVYATREEFDEKKSKWEKNESKSCFMETVGKLQF